MPGERDPVETRCSFLLGNSENADKTVLPLLRGVPLLVERVCFFYTCDTNLGVPSQKLRIRTTTVDIPFCSVLPSELPRAKRHGAQQRNCTGKKEFFWHLRYQSWTPFFSSKGAVLPRIEFSQVGLGQRTMAISTRSFARSSLTSGQSDPSRAGTEEPPSQQ